MEVQLSVSEREELSTQGWLELSVSSTDELVGLARSLGTPHPSSSGASVIDHLVPTRRQHARSGTMSSYLGFERFPFHTDGAYLRTPPEFILLRLADGAISLRPTLICALSALSMELEQVHMLMRDTWIVRGSRRPFLSPVLCNDGVNRRTLLRFDRFCMRPASARSARSAKIFESVLEKANPVRIDWARNKALILDNWQVLHARGDGPLDCNEGRVLERISVGRRE